jgi:hypothetical protein
LLAVGHNQVAVDGLRACELQPSKPPRKSRSLAGLVVPAAAAEVSVGKTEI